MITEARSGNLNGRAQMGFLNISGKIYPLYEGLNSVGRSKNATVIIKNANVSQNHALITIVDGKQHFVSDLQSVNGTTFEKNKLQPMLLYKISNNSVINFANVRAEYKMVSNQPHSTAEGINIGNQQINTQNLNDSFFVAETQVLDNTNVNNSLHCFEDDFNFSDIPSPPVCEISERVSEKPDLTIHELPTQILETYTTPSKNQVPNTSKENETKIAIHDLPTQKIEFDFDKNQVPNTSKGSETKMSIHDLPTQSIEFDFDKNQVPNTSKGSETKMSIHDLPTQAIEFDFDKNKVPNTSKGSGIKMAIHDLPTQKIEFDFGNDECVKDVQAQNNSLHSQPTQLINETIEECTSIESEKPPGDNENKLANDTALDIIDETVLDDSGLDTTLQSVNNSAQNVNSSILQEEIPPSPNSDSHSELQVQQLHRRTLKPITDDTEEEITNSGSDVVRIDSKGVNKKPLPESTPEDSESEEICKSKLKKKIRQIVSDGSDSETDIEDALDSKTNDVPASNKDNDSGSETEIDDIDVQDQLKKLNSSQSKDEAETMNAVTNTEPSVSESKTEQHLKDDVNIEESDSDRDDFDIDMRSKSGDNSNNQKLSSDNSDVIPATQASDDEDDDFCFVPKNNSTLISTKNTNQTEDQIFDVSQKLKELRKSTVPAQSCTEESIHFYLSGCTEDNDKNKKQSEEQNEDDDKTPDMSDVEDNDNINVNINKETQNVFDQPTQKVDEDPKHFPVDTNIDKSADKDDSIFAMATQKISEVNIDNRKSNEEFQKPSSSISIKKKKATQDMSEDAIFMEPTQIITDNSKASQKEIPVTGDDDDDDAIFIQATQKYTNSQNVSNLEDKEDNEIFDQPTQVLVINNDKPILSDNNSNEKCEDGDDESIFMQPTQKYSIDNQNVSKQAKLNDSEIFKLPTLITKDKNSVSKSNSLQKTQKPVDNLQDATTKSAEIQDDDLFNQPTQVITTEDIFDQPTQKIEITKDDKSVPFGSKSTSKDISENSPSKETKRSLRLNKNTEERNKFDEVESQLEVMFASQTLKMSLQTNDRPSNPLVNVFDGKNSTESPENSEKIEIKEHESPHSTSTKEYCESSTLPMDELTDLKSLPKTYQKETEANNAKQGRPVRKRKANETNLSETVYLVETPKKRSLRNKEKAIQEASTSNTKANNKSSTSNANKTEVTNDDVTTTDDSESINIIEKQNDKNMNDEAKDTDIEVGNKNKTRASSRNKKQADTIQKTNKKNTRNNEAQENINQSVLNETVETTSKNQSNTSEAENQEEIENIRSKAKRKPSKGVISETVKNETFKGTSMRKQKSELKNNEDDTFTTASTSRALRNNKNESDASVIPASSDANANLELTPESIKPKSVNSRSTRKGAKAITSKETIEPVISTPTRVSKRTKRLISAEDDKNKPDIAAKRTKLVEMLPKVASPSNSSSNSEFAVSTPASTRSRRILSKNNEKSQSNQSVKKVKKLESPVSDEAATNSEKSDTSIDTTPKRSKQQLPSLNITASTLEKNRRTLKPKVVFTMMNSPELESVIRSLGGIIVDSVSACTVLVTGTLKRSQKLLSAVGQAKPICSPKWLQECKKANKFLDPWDYILEDEEAERNWNFSLKESLDRSKTKKLLEEYTVLLAVSEAVDVLKEAIESSGGKCVMKAPAKNVKSNLVVVGNPNKKTSYARFLKQAAPPTVVAPEAIFDGVLRQELRFQNHLLT